MLDTPDIIEEPDESMPDSWLNHDISEETDVFAEVVPQERPTEEPKVKQWWSPNMAQYALAHRGGEAMRKHVEHEALKTMRVCESHKHKTRLFTYALVCCLHCKPDFSRRCHRFGDRLYADKKTEASTSSTSNGSMLSMHKLFVSIIDMSESTVKCQRAQ